MVKLVLTATEAAELLKETLRPSAVKPEDFTIEVVPDQREEGEPEPEQKAPPKPRKPWSDAARAAARERMLKMREEGKVGKKKEYHSMIDREKDEERMQKWRREMGPEKRRFDDTAD